MREREVQHEPQVLAGEDEIPRQPALADRYVAGAPPSRRARTALWIALAVLLAVAATILLWALVS